MLTVIAWVAINFAATAPATKEAVEITEERLIGTWLYDDENHGQILMLKKDGTYSQQTSGITAKTISGKWSLNERGQLVRTYVGRSGKGDLETRAKVLRLSDDEMVLQTKPDVTTTFKRTK